MASITSHNKVTQDNRTSGHKNIFVTVLLTILAFLGAQLASGIIVTIIAIGVGGETPESVTKTGSVLFTLPYVFGAAAVFYVLLMAMVVLILRIQKQAASMIGLKPVQLSQDLVAALAAYAVYFLVTVVIRIALDAFSPQILEPEQELGFDRDSTGLTLLPIFVSLVILPALGEELLARGYLFSGLRRSLKYWPAVIITSMLFALPHIAGGEVGTLLWIAVIDTFVLSLFLCYLRETTGRLWAPIFLHGLKNFVAFLVLFVYK